MTRIYGVRMFKINPLLAQGGGDYVQKETVSPVNFPEILIVYLVSEVFLPDS